VNIYNLIITERGTFVSKKPAKWYLAAIILILIVPICPPFTHYQDIIFSIYICALFEGMILVAVLRRLRKLNMLFQWKAITFYVVIIVISIYENYLLSSYEIQKGPHFQSMILSFFILFALLYFAILKIIFAIGILRAGLLGLIMGFINVILAIATIPIYK
jgi:hypothetical protein